MNTYNVKDTTQNYLVYEESRKWNIDQEERKSTEPYPEMNEILAIANKNFKTAITVSSMRENNMLSVNKKEEILSDK